MIGVKFDPRDVVRLGIIGVGRIGFTWSGSQGVTRMAEWPDWTPPPEMLAKALQPADVGEAILAVAKLPPRRTLCVPNQGTEYRSYG